MEENQKPKKKFRPSILALKLGMLALVGTGLSHAGMLGLEVAQAKLSQARAAIIEKFQSVKVIREYIPHEQKPLAAILSAAADRHSVSKLLLLALIQQESGHRLRPDRIRFEPHLHGKFKCNSWETEAECKAYASSWGLTQVVYGFWKEACQLESYSDLLDPEINVNCGASILGECLKRNQKLAKVERYKVCLGQYNGDRTGRYAGEVLERLTNIVIEQEL